MKTNVQHRDLAAGRWFTLTLAEQLGHIGSEVGRCIAWHEKKNTEYFERAFARMIELLDLTLSDDRWKGPKRKELVRVREALCDSFEGGKQMGIPLSSWDNYFLPFAIMARREQAAQKN